MMKIRRDNDVLRPTPRAVLTTYLITLCILLVGGVFWLIGGFSRLFAIATFIGGAVSLRDAIETHTSVIVLDISEVRIQSIRERRTIPKEEIESVMREAGSVFVRLRSGEWNRIPVLGNAQSVMQCVRSWLKKNG